MVVDLDARNSEPDDSGRIMRLCTEDGVNSGPLKVNGCGVTVGSTGGCQ